MRTAPAALVWILSLNLGNSVALAADKPPLGINLHYAWCAEPKADADKLKRYEGFWKVHLPENADEYNDDLHVRLVRKCAYRLAELYAAKGDAKNCRKMIRWLEANDGSLPGA